MKCEHPDHNDHETCEDRAVSCHKDCVCCQGIKTDFGPNGPQPGTAAYTAFIMAQLYPPEENDLPDDYWDDFKEELKDGL